MSSRLIPASELKPAPVAWLWQDRIPLGAVSELIGGPGQAKSSLTHDLAARITTGRPMPGYTDGAPPADVILLQAEDHPARTVVPNLVAAGADLRRVHLCSRLHDGCGELRFPEDIGVVESAMTDLKARLLVLDPAASYLGGNLHNEQAVRKTLAPFSALAEKLNIAVLLVRHLRKSAARDSIHLGTGSIAFVAIVRSSLLVGNDPTSDDAHRHVLTVSKSNLASAPSLVYRTVRLDDGAIGIDWLGDTKTTAQDLAKAAGSASDVSALQEAMYVLFSLLADGPLPANEVARRVARAGVTSRTLHRAKALLNVKSIKSGSGRGSQWFWRLPDDDRTYRAFIDHDLDRLMDRLFSGPDNSPVPDSCTEFPDRRIQGDRDDGQLV